MREKWTGKLVGQMHVYEISNDDLAKELGLSKAYVSMLLSGQRHPPNARERLTEAVNRMVNEKKQVEKEK